MSDELKSWPPGEDPADAAEKRPPPERRKGKHRDLDIPVEKDRRSGHNRRRDSDRSKGR